MKYPEIKKILLRLYNDHINRYMGRIILSLFLSLIGPKEWNMLYIGSFKLLSNNKWEKIDE